MNKRVIGLGGIFFKAQDQQKMYEWYEKHLGIQGNPQEGAMFHWRRPDNPHDQTFTAWSIFPHHSRYFDPSTAPFMIN